MGFCAGFYLLETSIQRVMLQDGLFRRASALSPRTLTGLEGGELHVSVGKPFCCPEELSCRGQWGVWVRGAVGGFAVSGLCLPTGR